MTHKLKPRIYRVVSIVFVLAFVLLSYVNESYGWHSYNNHKTNEASGMPVTVQAVLQKLEKTALGEATEQIVPGAEFYLYKAGSPDDAQIGGRYVTDQNGQIRVQGLSPGEYYFLETQPGYGYTFDQDDKGAPVARYGFTVTGLEESGRLTVTAYNRRLTGPLTIQKNVVNADASPLTTEQKAREFTFTVTFSDGGTYACRIADGPPQTVESGGTIKLRHGQSAVFDKIPVGVLYTVEEAGCPGYAVASQNHQGEITAEGSLAVFTNTRVKGSGSLTVTKSVAGKGADKDKEFAFTAVIDGVTHSFLLKHGQIKVFDNLPAGTSYTVTEDGASLDGYTASPASYAGQTINGSLTLPFVNVLGEETGAPGSLSIAKRVTGQGADRSKLFTFSMTFKGLPDEPVSILVNGKKTLVSAAAPQLMITLRHGERALLENLPAGVVYTVAETPESGYIAGIAQATGSVVSGYTSRLVFVNDRCDGPILIVRKETAGEVPADETGRRFQFVLEVEGMEPQRFELKAGESMAFKDLPAGAGYTVYEEDAPGYALTGVINGSGSLGLENKTALFTNTYTGAVMVHLSGEKTWELGGRHPQLPESVTIRLKKDGVVIDSAIVRPDRDGRWTYAFDAPKYEPDGVTEIRYTIEEAPLEQYRPAYHGMDVVNTYLAPAASDSVTVVKSIDGKYAPAADFTFVMTAQGGAPLPEGARYGRKAITITGAGEAAFGRITYEKAGTYTYTVTEQTAGEKGWTYDRAVYTYSVKVEEKSGALAVVSRKLTKSGKVFDKAAFVNRYDAGVPSDKIEISGSKTWVHKGSAADRHPDSVLVYVKVGGAVVAQRKVTASDHWTYCFRLPKYNAHGAEIHYTIDEEKIPGYQKKIEGYNLINTYDPNDPGLTADGYGKKDPPGDDDNVQTGGGRALSIGIALTLLSAALLFAARRTLPKGRKEPRRR